MFKKILVPLNGSAEAEQALEPAARLLQPMTGQLILMCLTSQGLLQIPNENQADADGELSPDEAQAYMAAVEQKTQEFNCLIQTKIVDRDDANAIVETAVAEAVDLVVMGTYGSTGLVSWLLGNVTEMVIHQASCPVLVVRSTAPWLKTAVALNGETWAETALPWATQVAQSQSAPLVLLHVLEDIVDLNSMELGHLEGLSDIAPDPARTGRRQAEGLVYLETIADQRLSEFPHPLFLEVLTGPAVPSLLKFVEAEQIDLVTLTIHNQSNWRRWFRRSTVDEILRGTETAILVVPVTDDTTP